MTSITPLNRFVAAYIADFQTKRFLFAENPIVPEVFRLFAVQDNVPVFINSDCAVGMKSIVLSSV